MNKPEAKHRFQPHLTERAIELRKSATAGERKLWREMQNLRLSSGIRFRRQQPIGIYIADFYCASLKCAVEVDGLSHNTKTEGDAARDLYFKSQGIQTFRFTEADALKDPQMIMNTMLSILNNQPHP